MAWMRGSRETSLRAKEKLDVNIFQLGSSAGRRPVKGMTQVGTSAALERIPGPTLFKCRDTQCCLQSAALYLFCKFCLESHGSEKRSMNLEVTRGLALIRSGMAQTE